MKITELLYAAQGAIANRDMSHDGIFDLCIREGKILCIRTKDLKPTDIYCVSLSKSSVVNGLSSEQWNRTFRTLHQELQNGRIV